MILSLFAAGRERERLPIFPLQTVLYPDMVLPLKIFEVRYMDMAKACLKTGSGFGVCLIREGVEVGAPAVPEPVGCVASIVDCDVQELGILRIRARGGERFRILDTDVGRAGLVLANVEPLAAESGLDGAPGHAECADFLRKVIPGIGAERFTQPLRYEDPTWVGFRLAEILPLRPDVKQKLLELTDAGLRLAVLHKFLRQQKLA